jgi:hypothetical protein
MKQIITPAQYANDLLISMTKDESIKFVHEVMTLYEKTHILHSHFDGHTLNQITAEEYFNEVIKCIGIKTRTDI